MLHIHIVCERRASRAGASPMVRKIYNVRRARAARGAAGVVGVT